MEFNVIYTAGRCAVLETPTEAFTPQRKHISCF